MPFPQEETKDEAIPEKKSDRTKNETAKGKAKTIAL